MVDSAQNMLRFRDDAPVSDPAVTLEAFTNQSNALAVRIEPGEDARNLLPHLDRIRLVEVNFPTFGDGRGYSSARVLREAGFTGEICAVGDVLVDQIPYMKRCGFDAFQPDQPLDAGDVDNALTRWRQVYQPATDGRVPIWNLRHG